LRAVERLTALWALSEAGLGGFLHAVKSPLTGTVIGGAAVLIICLIAHYSEKKFLAILRAGTIVLIIKAAVSPYSPFTAYIALAFQAVAGAVFFSTIAHFRTAAFLLGITGLMESALQKVLLLTILYGKSLWESINVFFGYVARQFGLADFNTGMSPSFWLIMAYFVFYGAVGVFVGLLGGSLPETIARAMKTAPPITPIDSPVAEAPAGSARRRKPFWKNRLLHSCLLISFIAVTLTFLSPVMHDTIRGVATIVQTVAVLLFWYFFAAPLMMKILRHILRKKEAGYGHDIRNVLTLFPQLKAHARQRWIETAEKNGFVRGWYFIIGMIVLTLSIEGVPQQPAAQCTVFIPKTGDTDGSGL